MYEIGIAAPGETPTNWTTWNVNNTTLYLTLPDVLSTYYSTSTANAKTISIYTRVKGCPDNPKVITTYIEKPYYMSSTPSRYGCDSIGVRPWNDYDGMFCYPLTLTITEGKTPGGAVLYEKSNWLYNVNNLDHIPFTYNGSYTVTFTDANGTTISQTMSPNFSATPYVIPSCTGYYFDYYVNTSQGKPFNCYPWILIENIKDASTGSTVGMDTLYTTSTGTIGYILSQITNLQYGKSYSVQLTFPDGSSTTTTKTVTPPTISASLYTISTQCPANYGEILLYLNSSGSSFLWPAGATISITGPNGFSQTYTFSTVYSSAYYYMPWAAVPPGNYTINYDFGGCPQTINWVSPGGYNQTGFGYTSQQTCSGLQITPTGSITSQGTPTPTSTYFRLMSGPTGYDPTVISPGGSLTLSSPGKYVLGIVNQNSNTACALATDTINYAVNPLALDPNVTSAYVCVEDSIGNISLSGANGVAPYTYQLWNSTNTVKQSVTDISTNGIAHFSYGHPDSTYTVRVSDACGSNFSQRVTLSNLSTAHIVYSLTNPICAGDTIKLNCITLGTTNYSWTGPNGYSSTEQNPEIPNAQSNMSGWYKVEVQPEFCGTSVKDSIYITAFSLATDTTTTTVENQEICASTEPAALSSGVTGGSGNYSYRWESSSDGVSGWTAVSGATGATYQPAAQAKSGT
jgi:hypothetical protein